MIFGSSKKEYKPLDLTIHNLTAGASLDYVLKSWMISEVFEYVDDNGQYTREYKLDAGDETYFM